MQKAPVKESSMVSPFFLFFLVNGSQIGVGLLNFQTRIIKGAEQDAWLSVLGVGLVLFVILWMIFFVVRSSSQGDLISFHTDLFGKYVGSLLNILLVLYFSFIGFSTLYIYIDLLQTLAFDRVPLWEITLAFCVVCYYIVSGGFRVVTGLAFWGVVIPVFLLIFFTALFPYLELRNIMPFFNHGWKDYLVSARESVYVFVGLECLFIYLPFIKNGQKSLKWAHFGHLASVFIYVVLAIFTFLYYTQGKLNHFLWPTLTMIKIVSFSFMESFEFIFIFVYLIVITSSACIYLWSATRILKVNFNFTPTKSLIGILALIFCFNILLEDISFGMVIKILTPYLGISLLFGYIPLLFLISLMKRAFRKS
ncbi:GerAB/ArcD/ProY family transporter [Pseudoneobacillus sp. C159]